MYLLLARIVALACSVLLVEGAKNCRDITIPVSASALNYAFPANLNLSSLSADDFKSLESKYSTILVTGTYSIGGTYCEPSKFVKSRQTTLQILVHGITYTRAYWSGTQFNTTKYSWVDYASNQGYPTLAVDRLCNGVSSHPNGLAVCQHPMNAEVMHQIIQQARGGHIAGRSFSTIVYVGHSVGSLIGNVLAQYHPTDVDSYILTGFTPFLIIGGFEFILSIGALPAILVDPIGHPNPDLTYLLASSAAGAEGCLYFGDYDRAVAQQDYATRGTVPAGEIATVFFGQLPALKYSNSVLVLNGQQDQVFCTRIPTDPLIGFRGECGMGSSSYTAQSQILYPSAKSFKYANVGNTGHDVNYHRTAQQAYQIAHQFLANEGF